MEREVERLMERDKTKYVRQGFPEKHGRLSTFIVHPQNHSLTYFPRSLSTCRLTIPRHLQAQCHGVATA